MPAHLPAMIEFGILRGPIGGAMDDLGALLGAFSSTVRPLRFVAPRSHLMKGDGQVLEAWTTLTYLASAFPAYTFGHTVLSQSSEPSPPGEDGRHAGLPDRRPPRPASAPDGRPTSTRPMAAKFPSAGVRVEQLSEAIDVLLGVSSPQRPTRAPPRSATRIASRVPRARSRSSSAVAPEIHARVAAEKADMGTRTARLSGFGSRTTFSSRTAPRSGGTSGPSPC